MEKYQRRIGVLVLGNTTMRESKMEKLRLKMYRSFQEDRYSDEVVMISQELDKLMNEFIVLPKHNEQ